MLILLTTCCKEKDLSPGNLPALKRYLSARIAYVYNISVKQKTPMRILSGLYGLLKPDDPIPYYDHPLSLEEVPDLKPRIIAQLDRDEINAITFFANPRHMPGWEPYYQVIEQSCRVLDIKIEVKII